MDSLSVVIPAYNEEAGLPICVTKVYQVLASLQLNWEIIIVNDGSSDKTGVIAKKLAKKYPNTIVVTNQPNRGYGGSLKAGFSVAQKEFIAFVPADNQFDFSDITLFIDKQIATNADIVSGIRPNGGHDPFHRLFVRWAWNTLIRAIFGYLATDVDCGFKLFRRNILDRVHLLSDGAMIDTQLFAGARARGMSIAETEVRHFPRISGKSTGGNLKVWIKAWRELALFWWRLRQELLTEKGKAVFRWEIFAILAITFLAGFLRLYKIDHYMTFLGDEGRDVLIARDIVLGRNFPFIGPGTSIGNMYLGPLYYYLMAPALGLAHFSPVGPAIQVAVIGLLTILLLWWVGRQWFSRIPALVISLLYSISPTIITYSTSSWNPNIMPFFALLTMYSLWKVWRFGYWRWLIVVGISLAFVLQSHYLGLLLLPTLAIFTGFAYLRHSQSSRHKYILVSTLIFLALMSPLLIFDLNPAHRWLNTLALVKFFSDRQTTVNALPYKALPNMFPLFSQINTSLVLGKNSDYSPLFTSVMVVSLVAALFVTRNPDLFFTSTWFTVGLLGLALYKQHIYDHYFGFLYPAVFLILGFLFKLGSSRLSSRVVIGLIVTGVILLNVNRLPLRYPPNNQLDRTRQIANLVIDKSRGQPFNLALIAKHNYDQSYRYFLALANAPYSSIHDRLTDQLFVICEDPACEPIGNPLWEIAAFGWAKIDRSWEFSAWGIKVFHLVPNPSGRPA